MKQPLRSALFVPATRPERIAKAMNSGADAIIVDLEDAVGKDHKDSARETLRTALANPPDGPAALLVRINATGTPWFKDDLAACAGLPAVAGLILAKAETSADLQRAAAAGKPLWPLLESARGFLNLAEIATSPAVERLVFGALDAALDLNLENGDGARTVLDTLRGQLILHSRAAGLAPPLESVVPEFRDTGPVRRTAQRARQMGFAGMLCIHPAQLPAIHEAFGVDEAQRQWARKVLEAAAEQPLPFQFDGEMVDEPVITRARRLLGGGR